MHVATILPVPHLHLVRDDQYHLCLAHLVRDNKKYRDFYQHEAERGNFVIIDNGAAEGQSQEIELIHALAQEIKATELVLPDIIYDKDETLRRAGDAGEYIYKQAGSYKPSLMVVPQGADFAEWCECAEEMSDWPIDVIGISKFCTPRYGAGARYRCVKYVRETLNWDVEIHLLGCWSHPVETGQIQSEFRIRGTDSAIAYVYTAHGQPLLPRVARPEHEVDFIRGRVDEKALLYNIDLWRRYSRGEVE